MSSKISRKSKTSRQLKPVTHRITEVYMFVMLAVFPLYVGRGGYANITSNKYSFFSVVTLLYFLILLLGGIGSVAMGEMKMPTVRGISETMSLTRWALIAYALFCILSSALSEYGSEVWLGLGRYEGLRTILLYIGLFFAIAYTGKFQSWYIYLLGIAVVINCGISVLQYAGYNPFHLFPAGYTYHDAFVLYANRFIGTLGNTNLTSAFLCLVAPLFHVGFVLRSARHSTWFLIPWACTFIILGISKVLAGLVGLCVMLIVTTPLISRTTMTLARSFVSIGIGIVSFGLVSFLGMQYDTGVAELFFKTSSKSLIIIATGFVFAICGRIIYTILENKINPRLLQKGIVLLEAALLVSFLVAIYIYPIGDGFLFELNQLLHGNIQDRFGTGRIKIWKETFKLVPEHLWFGGGPDTLVARIGFSFERESEMYGGHIQSIVDTAHNDYLNILVNTGLFSLVAYLLALVGSALDWMRLSAKSVPIILCGASILCYLLQIFFSFSLCIVAPLFWIIFGLLTAEIQNIKGQEGCVER